MGLTALVISLFSGCDRESVSPYSDSAVKDEYVAIYKKDCALNNGRGCEFLGVVY
jgi:hypothetical protein